MKNEKVKVGVIGIGIMGQYHIQKYLNSPHADFVGVYDTNPAQTESVAKKFGVRTFNTIEEILFEADAVTIASPTPTHFKIAKMAIEAGVHVLIEKPICETPEEGEFLGKLAEQNGLVLQVGFIDRFRFVQLTRDIPFREVRFIECHRLSSALPREKGIDVISDLMIHDIDLALSLVRQEPTSISAVGVPIVTSQIDVANVRLEFANGAIVNLNASRVYTKTFRKFRVFADNQYVSVDLQNGTIDSFCVNESKEIKKLDLAPQIQDPLQEQCDSFLRCVQGNLTPLVGYRDGVRALRLVYSIKEHITRRAFDAHSNIRLSPPVIGAT